MARTFDKSREQSENCLKSEKLRLNKTAFTRESRLGAKRLVHMILQRIYRALQLHLDWYYDRLDELPVSKQALSQARQHLNPEFIRGFVDITAEEEAMDKSAPTYKGMRLVAIDGSAVALENTADLKKAFGCSGRKKNAVTALASIAFDPLSQVVFDSQMDRYATDERELARKHVKRLMELGLQGSLLLFDRWYPSAEFICFLQEMGFHFVMRVRRKWNLAVDDTRTQSRQQISYGEQTCSVRVLKVKLSTGEEETLLTSLNQKQLPIDQAGDLYFQRWKVETAYDLIKSKLQLENFSGKSKVAVLQDFYATIYLTNLAAFVAQAADARIAAADQAKGLKHTRKANRNRTISKLREAFLCLLVVPDTQERDVLLERLIREIERYPVSFVPDRSPPRKPPRHKRFYIAKKSVV